MGEHYIRICPVCERENAPEATRCMCGTSLMGVDFSIMLPDEPVASVLPVSQSVPPPAAATPPHVTEYADAPAQDICGHADCAQPNPPGTERCLYCNRPMLGGQGSHSPAQDLRAKAAELQLRLPALLRQRYTALELLPTAGAEADLLRVTSLSDATQRVVKLYRTGLQGDDALFGKLKQANDPHVIRMDEAGIANGVRFEVMEYVEHGSLRDLLKDGPASVDRIREIVSEIGQALARVQALNILHRDLKPENVLVRTLTPLALVLTDFGIASIRMGTQHFTGGARTTRYAAPEALTGVIDERADWWSLGMIALEAVLGRHPFEDLNEQVVNHHLATQPVDVRPVFHDGLRKLCRGLLMRDPRARWSWPEVQRWLADDPTLVEVQEGAVGTAVRPYRIADSQCHTAVELAVTLLKHWQLGAADLARGNVAKWLEDQLHDYNLLRTLQDILDVRGVTDDWRLLKFVLAVVPDVPAVWKGVPVSRESLLIAARKASTGDCPSTEWLQSIHSEDVLELLTQNGRAEAAAFRAQWLQGLERFGSVWDAGREAEDRWRRAPKAWYGSSQVVVDVDYALYLQSARMQQPPPDRLHGSVLLAVCLPAYVHMIRTQLIATLADSADICPWFEALGPLHAMDGVTVVVAKHLLPLAQEDMAREKERLSSAQHQGGTGGEDGTGLLLREIKSVVDLLRAGLRTEGARSQVRKTLEDLQTAGLRVIRSAPVHDGAAKLRSTLDSLMSGCMSLQAQIDAVDAVYRTHAIWLAPNRLLVGGGLLLGLWLLLSGVASMTLLAGVAAVVFWRYRVLQQAQTALDAEVKTFQRLCRKASGGDKAADPAALRANRARV